MTALTNFLLNTGYTRVRRTANRWIKGVYDDNYRTTTGKNHPYTEPDYEDPYALIERIVLDQENVSSRNSRSTLTAARTSTPSSPATGMPPTRTPRSWNWACRSPGTGRRGPRTRWA
jgi:hypothetical protein